MDDLGKEASWLHMDRENLRPIEATLYRRVAGQGNRLNVGLLS